MSAVATEDGYVAVGFSIDPAGDIEGVVWTSSDAVHWERLARSESLAGGLMANVVIGGDGLVAAGPRTGMCMHCDAADMAGAGSLVWTSVDGRSWQRMPERDLRRALVLGLEALDGRTLAYGAAIDAGSDRPENGRAAVWLSEDHATWSAAPLPPEGEVVRDVVASRGILLALVERGSRRVLARSDDGLTWSETAARVRNVQSIAASAGAFVAVDRDGSVLVSSDADRWRRVRMPGPAADATVVGWIGDRFLATGFVRRNPDLRQQPTAWLSANGRQWAEATRPPGYDISRFSSLRDGALVRGWAPEGSRVWLVRATTLGD